MFTYKASFEFGWITLINSLTVGPFFAAKKCYEELDINEVCVLDLYFLIGKIRTLTVALMYSFRIWYVQCLAKRLTLNLIEFIHLKVWRSFDSLAVKNFMKNWITTSAARFKNPTAWLSFQNCLAVIPVERLASHWMNASHWKFDGYLIPVLWKTD